MKQTKRLFSLLLALALLLACTPHVPLTAEAATVASGTCGGSLNDKTKVEWTLDSNGVLTISGTGAMWNYGGNNSPWDGYQNTIEKIIIEEGITTIGEWAFNEFTAVTSVSIPSSVTTIKSGAFNRCTSLRTIDLPSSVTSIERGAFQSCSSLVGVKIPNSVYSIEPLAFSGCTDLREVQLPTRLNKIGEYAFQSCKDLDAIEIPSTVTSISVGAFSRCSSLQNILVDTNNTYFCSQNGVLYSKDKTKLVCYPGGRSGAFAIPDSVLSVEQQAFEFCERLSDVTIPNSVVSIGRSAFESCTGLTDVYIPNSVTSIGACAFKECTKLVNASLSNSVTILDRAIFEGCAKLKNISLPSSVTDFYSCPFNRCASLEKIVIPASASVFYDMPFGYGCTNLSEIFFDGSAPTFCENAFEDITANAYYWPDESWTEDVMQDYGGNITWIAEKTSVHLEISDDSANRGETFSVEAYLKNAKDIRVGSVILDYDTDALELIDGSCHVEGAKIGTVTSDMMGGTFSLDEAAKVSGKIFTFEFRVQDNAVFDDYPISVTAAIGLDSTEIINATGITVTVVCDHSSYGKWEKVDDVNHKRTCTICTIYTETKPHDWDEGTVTKNPTCKETGTKVYSCATCGGTKTETLPVTNDHEYGGWEKVDDTKHRRTCTICKTATETASHSWDSGSVTKPTSCTESSIKIYTCTECKATSWVIIPAPGHKYDKWEKVDDTYHKHTCTVCTTHSETEQHDFGEDHICTGCGYKAYTVGDFDGDGLVTDADVIYLLWYTVFPEDYPLNGADADFTGDGAVTDADVIYLLWHTVFPEDYPLEK